MISSNSRHSLCRATQEVAHQVSAGHVSACIGVLHRDATKHTMISTPSSGYRLRAYLRSPPANQFSPSWSSFSSLLPARVGLGAAGPLLLTPLSVAMRRPEEPPPALGEVSTYGDCRTEIGLAMGRKCPSHRHGLSGLRVGSTPLRGERYYRQTWLCG